MPIKHKKKKIMNDFKLLINTLFICLEKKIKYKQPYL